MTAAAPVASTSGTVSQGQYHQRAPQKPRIELPSGDPSEVVKLNRDVASAFQVNKHKKEAARNWDIFYKRNKDGFFKDRHWTDREFDALAQLEQAQESDIKGKSKVIMEVGCGTGAFVYPLLERYPSSKFYAFDFSTRAVDLVKSHPSYSTSRVHAFVHDLTSPPGSSSLAEQLSSAPPDFKSDLLPSSSSIDGMKEAFRRPDIISCIFVLSALPPGKQRAALRSLVSILAPGGHLLMRDYAIHDAAQLRFHALPSKGYASVPSLLSEPTSDDEVSASVRQGEEDAERGKAWYRRGDSTMTYFFTPQELQDMIQVEVVQQDDVTGQAFKIVGECTIVERRLENKAQNWDCTRRFVHASWQKITIE
ncbi:hypothetical protein OIO90_002784 [Microbotryomycetes sp. JL221]|nr:hypothetical protein OIO90_002784 [Microbotryomycetes sp. JL221]